MKIEIFMQPPATVTPSSNQSEPVAVKQEKTVSVNRNVLHIMRYLRSFGILRTVSLGKPPMWQ